MELDGRLIYRRFQDKRDPGPRNVMVEQMLPGPGRAVLFHWWKRRWMFDPQSLHNAMMRDSKEGWARLTFVDRVTAEAVAREFGQELPSEEELFQMMEEGAAEMYATDDRMKYIQLYEDDPGANLS